METGFKSKKISEDTFYISYLFISESARGYNLSIKIGIHLLEYLYQTQRVDKLCFILTGLIPIKKLLSLNFELIASTPFEDFVY